MEALHRLFYTLSYIEKGFMYLTAVIDLIVDPLSRTKIFLK